MNIVTIYRFLFKSAKNLFLLFNNCCVPFSNLMNLTRRSKKCVSSLLRVRDKRVMGLFRHSKCRSNAFWTLNNLIVLSNVCVWWDVDLHEFNWLHVKVDKIVRAIIIVRQLMLLYYHQHIYCTCSAGAQNKTSKALTLPERERLCWAILRARFTGTWHVDAWMANCCVYLFILFKKIWIR